MALIKKTDVAPERPVIILIYGVPGVGKTSIANTAKNPILIDTDRGFDRAYNRVDTIVARSWDDVLADEGCIKDYSTVVTDTAKSVLDDFLIEYVERRDYKLKTNKQKMFGAIGEEFKNFIDQECPPAGKNKFDEDFAGYYFFHDFLHKSNYCRLPDGAVKLDTIDWIKGTKATEKKIRYAIYG